MSAKNVHKRKKKAADFRLNRKQKDRLQNILILVLLIGIVLQGGRLWSAVLPKTFSADTHTRVKQEYLTENTSGATPIRIAVRREDGLFGAEYHEESVENAYEITAELWAEALSNAGVPYAATMEAYQKALKCEMMLLQFDGAIPLDILAGFLGCRKVDTLVGCKVGTIVLSNEGSGQFQLYIRDNETGMIQHTQTMVDADTFDAVLEQFEPNDCVLAAEENMPGSPDLMYYPNALRFGVISFAKFDGINGIDGLLDTFNLDAGTVQRDAYKTSSGTKVYPSGTAAVRIAANGNLSYDGTSLRVPRAQGHELVMQYVQSGYLLSQNMMQAIDCGGKPSLLKAYEEEDTGRYIVVYGMQLNHVPVDQAAGYFSRFVFENGILVHADAELRFCQSTGEIIAVMPERQAAASQNLDASMLLSLRYVDEINRTIEEESEIEEAAMEEENTDMEDPWEGNVYTNFETEETTGTAWYDSEGTPVIPKWYIMQQGKRADSILTPEAFTAVYADFDFLIRGGNAA